MFKLIENYEVDRRILTCNLFRYSPAETSTISSPKSQIYINIPKEDGVISLLNTYLKLNSEVIKKTDKNRYVDGKDKRSINLGPIALFSIFKVTTSGEKHLEDISHAHMVSLKYKLITSAKDSDDLSIVFDRDRGRRRDETTRNKNVK